jgi:hypothetical protein
VERSAGSFFTSAIENYCEPHAMQGVELKSRKAPGLY